MYLKRVLFFLLLLFRLRLSHQCVPALLSLSRLVLCSCPITSSIFLPKFDRLIGRPQLHMEKERVKKRLNSIIIRIIIENDCSVCACVCVCMLCIFSLFLLIYVGRISPDQ